MNPDKHYLRLFFDMENTVTGIHTPIDPAMKKLLASLTYDIVVVSSHTTDIMQSQLGGLGCHLLGQHGNEARLGNEVLWSDTLTKEEQQEVLHHIESLPESWDVLDKNDRIENRGCTISYSFIGHHAPREEKKRFDPDQARRITLLAQYPFQSDTLEAKIGDSTTIDYVKKGHTKGFNVARLCRYKNWNIDTCLYVGDALFPGGTDESVIGIVDTQSVTNPDDTLRLLTTLHK